MSLSRTFIAGCSLMAMLVGLPMQASAADNYPQRPIKLIVPFPPGGGTDMFGRVVAEKLTAEFGWNVVVENKPGAGGSIGVDAAVKAEPDGSTIVLGQTSNLAVNPTLYPNLTSDTLKDLKPVVLVAEHPIVLDLGECSKYIGLTVGFPAPRKQPKR